MLSFFPNSEELKKKSLNLAVAEKYMQNKASVKTSIFFKAQICFLCITLYPASNVIRYDQCHTLQAGFSELACSS